MQNRKIKIMVTPTRHLTHNSSTSFFTNEELERALPRLSFFDCHAKPSRKFIKANEPEKQNDSKSDKSNISIKSFDERHLIRNTSNDMTNPDNKNSVLGSCKISDQDENSTKIKPVSNYLEANSVSITTIDSNSQYNIGKVQNADNCEMKDYSASEEDQMVFGKHELNDSVESFKSNDSILKFDKRDAIKIPEKKTKSEGFQYLMEYLLCLKNTSNNNNDDNKETGVSQTKPSDPKYLVDSLQRSASIFAAQHQVLDSRTNNDDNDNNLFTAVQQLHSRLIVSTNQASNLDPSSCEQSISELDQCRQRLDEWMEKVSTNEFMNTLDDVLSILGDNICQPWSGLRHCRYLRLTPSQIINYASRQKHVHFKTD